LCFRPHHFWSIIPSENGPNCSFQMHKLIGNLLVIFPNFHDLF
jgi:hypothetical protein